MRPDVKEFAEMMSRYMDDKNIPFGTNNYIDRPTQVGLDQIKDHHDKILSDLNTNHVNARSQCVHLANAAMIVWNKLI